MRYLLVVLILIGTGAGLWYTLEGGKASMPVELDLAPVAPGPGRLRSEPAAQVVEPVQLMAPGATSQAVAKEPASETPPQKAAGRTTLEGTLVDRFGSPVAKERVFLLAATQGHPAAGADIRGYVTAISSKRGTFSLSLPGPGPWRIGVGPPGAPRIPPSEARTMSATAHASIVLPGATALRVAFDALPEGDAPVTLEFLTLVEPGVGGASGRAQRAGGRGQRGQRGQRRQDGTAPRATRPGGRANRGNGTGARGSKGGANGEDGARRGNESGNPGGKTRDARAPLTASAQLHASLQQEPGNPRPAQEAPGKPNWSGADASRGRRGQRGNQDWAKDPLTREEVQPLGPPVEVWRAHRRQTLSAGERAAGVVEISNLPAGPVARLAVSVGEERREGVTRFTLQPDVITEVRVFPLQPGSDTLGYVVTARPLPATQARAGVQWDD